mgnify:CR=1 FL=1
MEHEHKYYWLMEHEHYWFGLAWCSLCRKRMEGSR